MADAPFAGNASPAFREAVERCARGELPATVAAMRVLMESAHPDEAEQALEGVRAAADAAARQRLGRVLELLRANPQAWTTIRGVIAGMEHAGEAASADEGVAYWAAAFDRAARVSPEGSVALYSLGNPELLRAATAEIVDRLRDWGLLGPDRICLDLGCGIGRLAEALAPEVREVIGIEVSAEMMAVAESRLGHLANVRLIRGSGLDLAPLDAGSVDLLVAADVFPYLVQSGLRLAETHVREAARVLRPGGSLVILNFSYRGDLERDRADVAVFASAAGFELARDGEALLSLWDGAVFQLDRNASGGERRTATGEVRTRGIVSRR
jgi:SAM-dependent methyltransferase